jgi:hypothetical protein
MGKIDAKVLKEELLSGNFTTIYYDRPLVDVVTAIEEHILDKIRAEIEQLRLHKSEFLTNDGKVCIDSQEVLAIIDKYKAKSEE